MEWFDWVVLGATVVLAALSVWIGSSVVRGMWDYILVSLLWAMVGAAWSATVLLRTTDRVARIGVVALLIGSLITVMMFGPVTALIYSDRTDWLVVGLLVIVPVGLILVRQRPIRLVWFVAPVIVVASAALVLSGVPGSLRFAAAEPELTRYVLSLDQGAEVPDYDEPVLVAGIPVFEVIRQDGQVLLVTGFIGILGDDPAGLAYVPAGTPDGVGWEHIRGPWYGWMPLGYVSE